MITVGWDSGRGLKREVGCEIAREESGRKGRLKIEEKTFPGSGKNSL